MDGSIKDLGSYGFGETEDILNDWDGLSPCPYVLGGAVDILGNVKVRVFLICSCGLIDDSGGLGFLCNCLGLL